MKVILLCLCFIVLEAAVHKSFLRRSTSLRERLAKMGKLNEVLKLGKLNLRTGSQRYIDYSDVLYLTDITIGTPRSQAIDYCQCGEQWHAVIQIHFSASSTYRPNGLPFHIAYGTGSSTGYLGVDTLSFAGFTYPDQVFAIATEIADFFENQPLDGIMGLGWPAIAIDNVIPPVQNLLSQFDQPVFTVYMSRHIDPVEKGDGGMITYGGYDNDNCDMSTLHWVPLSSQTYWQFTLNGFSVGSFSVDYWQQVISDTGTSFLHMPDNLFRHVIRELGTEYDEYTGLQKINCTKLQGGTDTPPPLVLSILGIDYAIPHDQYIIKLDIDDIGCYLAAGKMFSFGFGPSWILGDVFIRSYCNIHDVQNIRIGFANLKKN